jgi:hypothetical protein
MILKLLLKIWPSLIPIFSYIAWIVIQNMVKNYFNRKNFIEGEFAEVGKNGKKKKSVNNIGHFSLKNPRFIFVIYLSLIFMIFSFLFFAIGSGNGTGEYVPAQNIDGKIIPAHITN